MQVTLSGEEAELILRAIKTRLAELEDELVHTDSREFRAALEADMASLERVAAHLETVRGYQRAG